MSGRRYAMDRQVELMGERLEKERLSGEISEGEYDRQMKDLHDEAREVYDEEARLSEDRIASGEIVS